MNKLWYILVVLVSLYIIGTVVSFVFLGDKFSYGDKIVVVSLEGPISSSGDSNFFNSGGISSTNVVKNIKELSKDDSVKGIIFEINSPGGTVVASEEIADAIKNLNKTNYAVIRDVGASGGYWIASATDKIFVSPMSITGSIGVYGSYLEFSELFNKYGIGYERLVSGKYKDLGVPYKNLNDEEKELLQGKLNKIHVFFVNEVAKNRNMSVEKVSELATGEFYLGSEAKDLGLVDEFGDKDKAIEEMKKQLNLSDIGIVESRTKVSLLDKFLGNIAFQFGQGFGTTFLKFGLDKKLEINA